LDIIELKTTTRKTTGNGPARESRRNGFIPAVLYGPGKESVMLSVGKKELEKVIRKGNISQVLLNLFIEDDNNSKRTAMIKEFQTHPVTQNFLHVDFYEVSMDRKIRLNIPIVTKGMAKGVELGGVLQIVRRELEVLCLPGDIPESLEVDISNLDIGDAIHVQDIPRPETVEIAGDANFTVITVVSPSREEAPAAEGAAEEGEAAGAEKSEENAEQE
jgi:large subunit ribosomal protein L25